MKKVPEAMCIEKESFYFVPDPHTECSATSFVAATVTTEDAESSGSFSSEILLVVSSAFPGRMKSAVQYADSTIQKGRGRGEVP